MVGAVMGEQNVLHFIRLAPRLAHRPQDNLPVLRQAGIDHRYFGLSDQVRAHIPHPDPVDIPKHSVDTHTPCLLANACSP